MMRVFIFGGTRGLGLALARHYLALGNTVAVAGRSRSHFEAIETSIQSKLHFVQLDIADAAAVQQALAQFALPSLDLVIVTAGMYFNDRQQSLDAPATSAMLATNVSGLSHVLQHASAIMLTQGFGQLAAISSIAGLLSDYPGASLYSATKRSVLQLCDAYRVALARFAISVTVIVPGYIDTQRLRELNGGSAAHKPFLMCEAQAVERVSTAIQRRMARCVFPWQMQLIVRLLSRLPAWLQRRILLPNATIPKR